jgi:hypothetical protein
MRTMGKLAIYRVSKRQFWQVLSQGFEYTNLKFHPGFQGFVPNHTLDFDIAESGRNARFTYAATRRNNNNTEFVN